LLNSYVLGAVENSSKMLITMEIIGETVKRGEKLLLFRQVDSGMASAVSRVYDTFSFSSTFPIAAKVSSL
jgi:hypothetical protein